MRVIVILILVIFPVLGLGTSAHSVDSSNASKSLTIRNLAAATGQTWVGGQLYQIAKGSYNRAELDSETRQTVRDGISFQLLRAVMREEIEAIAIGQGSVLYASAFPMPSQLPNFVDRSSLRDKRSRDLWVMIQFKDGSRANLIADLDPEDIDAIYAEAEPQTSRVNGFRVSKMKNSTSLFEKLGRKKISATRAKASKQGQIVVAEFELK